MKGISLEFERGKITAIIGSSGSGKTTLVKLIERFYDPTEGVIAVGNIDLWDLNVKSFRKHVGYVGQEPQLFNESIKQNLLYACPEASDEEILHAL